MTKTHTVRVRDRATGKQHVVEVPEDRYILQTAEEQDVKLPFLCRNGACTSCAAKVISGELAQPEAMGLSPKLKDKGYALLCVSYPRSDLEVKLKTKTKYIKCSLDVILLEVRLDSVYL